MEDPEEIPSAAESRYPRIDGDVWLCGDVHGEHGQLFRAVSANKVKDGHLVILGDVGIGFYPEDPPYLPRQYRNLSKRASEHNLHLWLIRGNHDNPAFWEEPLKQQAEEMYPNIHLLQQGFVEINGDLHYVFPGGVSLDRIKRTEGKSYWKDDVTRFDPSSIETPVPHVKAILGHTGPKPLGLSGNLLEYFSLLDPGLDALLVEERQTVASAIHKLQPDYYFYGHYHVSWNETHMCPKCRVLNICEILKLDYSWN